MRFHLRLAGFFFAIIVLAACSTIFAGESVEKPFVHPLFADHVVLQRDCRVPVWGWTKPGATVSVRFAGHKRTAIANAEGRWEVALAPMRPSSQPRTLTIACAGESTVTVNDVLVGDVWIC